MSPLIINIILLSFGTCTKWILLETVHNIIRDYYGSSLFRAELSRNPENQILIWLHHMIGFSFVISVLLGCYAYFMILMRTLKYVNTFTFGMNSEFMHPVWRRKDNRSFILISATAFVKKKQQKKKKNKKKNETYRCLFIHIFQDIWVKRALMVRIWSLAIIYPLSFAFLYN